MLNNFKGLFDDHKPEYRSVAQNNVNRYFSSSSSPSMTFSNDASNLNFKGSGAGYYANDRGSYVAARAQVNFENNDVFASAHTSGGVGVSGNTSRKPAMGSSGFTVGFKFL